MAFVARPFRLLLASAAALAALVAPASASAACTSPATSTPFAQFGDTNSYSLAPNGGFESGSTGWTLAGGARVVSGNEPWKVRGSADARSLVLPVATTATATSSVFCTNANTPSIRLFYRSDNFGDGWGYLEVDALYYSTTTGAYVGAQNFIATLERHDGSWTATSPIGLVPYSTDTYAKLVFTAHGSGTGTFSIDDVYVDPWRCC